MYCRNCGEPFADEKASVCLKCGVQKGQGNQFCPYCGAKTDPMSSICVNCGTSLENFQYRADQKSKLIAALLGIFLGSLGIHNFYLGYNTKGIIQLSVTLLCSLLACCTLGISSIGIVGMQIWAIIEAVLILTGNISVDGKGVPLKD